MDIIETPYDEDAEFIECRVSYLTFSYIHLAYMIAIVSLHALNEVGDCKVQDQNAAWILNSV